MPNGWCCQTWIDLSDELASAKLTALDKLIKRGIPKSTFSPIYRMLEGLATYCPLCGSRITKGVVTQNEVPVVGNPTTPAPKPLSPSTVKCPPCRGSGHVSDGVNCMTCLGAGVLDKSNPNRATFDPVYAEELAGKMESVTQRIVVKESEIEKNPQPLREDARPENWGVAVGR